MPFHTPVAFHFQQADWKQQNPVIYRGPWQPQRSRAGDPSAGCSAVSAALCCRELRGFAAGAGAVGASAAPWGWSPKGIVSSCSTVLLCFELLVVYFYAVQEC